MIDTKKLEKLIAKYDRQYETNYQAYQETGITRYSTAYHNAEDMGDALRSALNAAADHSELVSLRVQLSRWRSLIERMGVDPDPASVRVLLREIAATAKMYDV